MGRPTKRALSWISVIVLMAIVVITGCAEPDEAPPSPTAESVTEEAEPSISPPQDPSPPPESPTPLPEPATSTSTRPQETPTTPTPSPTPASEPEAENLVYEDHFDDANSGWPDELEFDNYYIGYHGPEWYHLEVHEPDDSALTMVPGQTFDDVTAEATIFVSEDNTAPEGDFRYGLVLRRSGNQYYAFLISPRTMTWSVLKRSPEDTQVLEEGEDDSIRGQEGNPDTLRVDASGSTFTFHINDQPVSQVNDADYGSGELGFLVETFDSPQAHIHYDSLTVRKLQPGELLYEDDFTDSSRGWPDELEFDNYYIGYHGPEWYHLEVHEPDDSALTMVPGQMFDDVTAEATIFVSEDNTAPEGDFRYGLVLRRSGNQYYAFLISPRTMTWSVLKRSPEDTQVLEEGEDDSIRGQEGNPDTLRVDASGSTFTFHINDQPVSQVSDADYSSGQLGFLVETFDSPQAHIHFDTLTVSNLEALPLCEVTVTALNLRPGPGVGYDPPLTALPEGTYVEPLTRSVFEPWIQVRVEETGQLGWVYAAPPYASCTFPLTELPLP